MARRRRRLTDTVRAELAHLAAAAATQQRHTVEAICCRAIALLDELEAALLVYRASNERSQASRLAKLSPERRRQIAASAAHTRWQRDHASAEASDADMSCQPPTDPPF